MNFNKTKPNFLALILIFSAIWIILTSFLTPTNEKNELTSPQKGFKAPDFELTTLVGQSIHLADLEGSPVIINFWASWCPPCQSEMPEFEKFYQEYQEKGLTVLAVNSTSQDELQAIYTFVANENLTFPILLDNDGSVFNLYQIQALPTTFFIDKNGMIKQIVIGGPISIATLRSYGIQLLKE